MKLAQAERNVILAPFTTYKIGGPADFFVAPRTIDELTGAISSARENQIQYFLLGTGANILIGDGGFRGLVIHNQFDDYHFDDTQLTAGSGAVIKDLIAVCTEQGLSGLEHYSGIPSSVGGAIWQNLHFLSPDRQRTMFISEVVAGATILTQGGQIRTVDTDFFQFGYDTSRLHHEPIVVLDVTFHLTPAEPRQIRHQIQENLNWRRSKQPQLDEFPSCGSVFKKIDGVGAGRLIEDAGLKGRRIGGAEISQKHANYIVNIGDAKAADVRALIELVQLAVKGHSGYQLEPEIGFIGEF